MKSHRKEARGLMRNAKARPVCARERTGLFDDLQDGVAHGRQHAIDDVHRPRRPLFRPFRQRFRLQVGRQDARSVHRQRLLLCSEHLHFLISFFLNDLATL